jgi:hypothetical protein
MRISYKISLTLVERNSTAATIGQVSVIEMQPFSINVTALTVFLFRFEMLYFKKTFSY